MSRAIAIANRLRVAGSDETNRSVSRWMRPARASAIRSSRHSGGEPSVRLPSRAPGATRALAQNVPETAPDRRQSLLHSRRRPVRADVGAGSPRRRADRGISRRRRAAGARRRDDLRADPTRRVGAGAGAGRGERRGEPHPAAHRPARRLRAEPATRSIRSLTTHSPMKRLPAAVGELARRMVLAQLTRAWGSGAQRRDPRRRRRRAAHVRRSRAAVGGDEPGAGFRARRRPRRPDRRLHHRGRRPGAVERPGRRPFRSLLGRHPRLPQDRLRPLARLARRARPDRPRAAAPRWRSTPKFGRSPPGPSADRRSSPARPAPTAPPRG